MLVIGFLKNLFSVSGDDLVLHSPVRGEAIPITQVPDPTFSEEMLGKGGAVIPSEGTVYAPCAGMVEKMFESGHAVSIISDFGTHVLIHVGLNTVKLQGKFFKALVSDGDRISLGQPLMEFDPKGVADAGYSIITPMVVLNSADYSKFRIQAGHYVTPADGLITLEK